MVWRSESGRNAYCLSSTSSTHIHPEISYGSHKNILVNFGLAFAILFYDSIQPLSEHAGSRDGYPVLRRIYAPDRPLLELFVICSQEPSFDFYLSCSPSAYRTRGTSTEARNIG